MAKKILIVDDSKTILKINTRIINAIYPDAEVVAFVTPGEAVESLKASKTVFDFALLDYNMEGMTGVELAQALVALSPAPVSYNKICVVSANIQEAVISKAKGLGMEFEFKPFDEAKLKSFLSKKGISHD